MTSMMLAGFGFLIFGFMIAMYQLWRVYRRGRIREREVASKLMESAWTRTQKTDEGSSSFCRSPGDAPGDEEHH